MSEISDTEQEIVVDATEEQQSKQPVVAQKPDISSNQDAVTPSGERLFSVGDYLLIESYIDYKTRHWLDTRAYAVIAIDDETGEVKLFDQKLKQYAYTNYKLASVRHGDILKLVSTPRSKKTKLRF